MEKKVLGEFGCRKFIYCSDGGLASEGIRSFNLLGKRPFIVTQSIKNSRLKRKHGRWIEMVSDEFRMTHPLTLLKYRKMIDSGSAKKNRDIFLYTNGKRSPMTCMISVGSVPTISL